MQLTELRPGLWRWTAPHPAWEPDADKDSPADWPPDVGCVLCDTGDAAVYIDALIGPDQPKFWRWADRRCDGTRVFVLTTIRFHRRSRDAFLERYGATTSSTDRDLPGSIETLPVRGAGETMFWLPQHRALVPGDRLISTPDHGLGLCPESWLRYLPSGLTIDELRELLRPLLNLPIELVLVFARPANARGRTCRPRPRPRLRSALVRSSAPARTPIGGREQRGPAVSSAAGVGGQCAAHSRCGKRFCIVRAGGR